MSKTTFFKKKEELDIDFWPIVRIYVKLKRENEFWRRRKIKNISKSSQEISINFGEIWKRKLELKSENYK